MTDGSASVKMHLTPELEPPPKLTQIIKQVAADLTQAYTSINDHKLPEDTECYNDGDILLSHGTATYQPHHSQPLTQHIKDPLNNTHTTIYPIPLTNEKK